MVRSRGWAPVAVGPFVPRRPGARPRRRSPPGPGCLASPANHGAARPGTRPARSSPARTCRSARRCLRRRVALGRSGRSHRRSTRHAPRYRGCATPPGQSARAAGRPRRTCRRDPRCCCPSARSSTGTGHRGTGRSAAGRWCRLATNRARTAGPRRPTAPHGSSPTVRAAGPRRRPHQPLRYRTPARNASLAARSVPSKYLSLTGTRPSPSDRHDPAVRLQSAAIRNCRKSLGGLDRRGLTAVANCDHVRMRLVAVVGAAPGIGKSQLCASLVDWLTEEGLAVDHFAEEHVLSRPGFAAVASEFAATGRVSSTVLVDTTARYLADAAAAGIAVVVMDSLIPFVPSLLAFGHPEHDIAAIVDDLATRIAAIPTVTVFLDGDAATALPRAAAREGPHWLAWYTNKLTRYGLLADPEPDLTAVCRYLAHERATTLQTLRRQPWNLVIIEHADTSPHEHVFHTARQAIAAFITDPAPTRSTRSTPS